MTQLIIDIKASDSEVKALLSQISEDTLQVIIQQADYFVNQHPELLQELIRYSRLNGIACNTTQAHYANDLFFYQGMQAVPKYLCKLADMTNLMNQAHDLTHNNQA